MKKTNDDRDCLDLLTNWRRQMVAVAAVFGMVGSAGGQTTIHVGGEGVIGDTSLSVVSGVATLPETGAPWTAAGGDGGDNGRYTRLASPTMTVSVAGPVV